MKGNNVFFYNGSPAAVTGGDNVIMMIYLGGGAMNVMYGGTIIDGTQITTRSVTANRIQANSITATELIQTESIIVNQAMIANATIGTLKVLDGDMSGVYAQQRDCRRMAGTCATAAFNALAGRRFLITYMGRTLNCRACPFGSGPWPSVASNRCFCARGRHPAIPKSRRSVVWDQRSAVFPAVCLL